MDEQADIAIIGGAVMGAAAAFWLSRLGGPALRIVVIEADPSFARSSTALSVASIRQQFTNPVNVRISRYGIDFIRNIALETGPEPMVPDLGFTENGYLFLAGSETAAQAMRNAQAMQLAEGTATELLGAAELAARFPHLDCADVVLASFGPRNEGWFDNMGLLAAFRGAARRAGVRFVTGRVSGLARDGARIAAVHLDSGARITAGAVVNAAGPRAAELMRMAHEDMPVEPRKRTVFVIDAPEVHAPRAPLMVDHLGYYLRPEGAHWITATVPDTDGPADPDDFEPDWHLFEDVIWERLYRRCPGFAAVKVLRAWAGHYAFNRFDQNAIIGRWPGLDNLFVMNGFSGHGLQQAPAVGRGIAELILHGGYRSLDLSDLAPERLFANRPVLEKAVV
ncbi:NAD(P)/FAD-dependent oxidoreductase [Rhodovulum strictum]|uniref:FAD-dependent oxidoreductase n=1 Tax=Rhodovulum strictum TaxID=58314 RepID=A0A844B9P1_9RHOB|nr:FAD-binding oxidoreductase [Rhodovulum strictum]MRH22310.1 FAD-dependent oxidoreductase [Rhodovulum strictum]